MKHEFDPKAGATCFEISNAEIKAAREIENGIIADYDEGGHIVGIKVLSVSKRGLGTPLKHAAWQSV